MIPGLGSCPEEGIGYPLQYSWASLETHTVKNVPAMQETWVWSLHWDDNNYQAGESATLIGWMKDMPEQGWKFGREFKVGYENLVA